jgi:hypothetical protein
MRTTSDLPTPAAPVMTICLGLSLPQCMAATTASRISAWVAEKAPVRLGTGVSRRCSPPFVPIKCLTEVTLLTSAMRPRVKSVTVSAISAR